MGSCSKDPSTNRGPDFAESGPNGPKKDPGTAQDRESQKLEKRWNGRGSPPPKPYGREARLGPHLCPSEDLAKRPEKRKEKLGLPAAPRHPVEEEGAASSTRVLVTR